MADVDRIASSHSLSSWNEESTVVGELVLGEIISGSFGHGGVFGKRVRPYMSMKGDAGLAIWSAENLLSKPGENENFIKNGNQNSLVPILSEPVCV